MPDWLVPLLPLLGVVVGQYGSSRLDLGRWQRDWLITQISSRREHYLALLDATYDLHVVSVRISEGHAVSVERITAVTATWRRQLSRSLILAPEEVQLAVAAYDQERGAFVQAVNAGDFQKISTRASELETKRVTLLARINDDLNNINSALARYVRPRPRWIGRSRSSTAEPSTQESS